MGHTGCGKSTLIQLLAGLLIPTKGNVYLDGKNINDANFNREELRKQIGIIFQYAECQLFESTVFKDVAFGLKHRGLSKEEMEKRVRWALEVTGFDYERICKQSPLSLSGGEKRRVAIAGVIAVKPRFLIMDEPIAGLDPLARDAFMLFVKQLNESGTTIIMISHNSDYISAFARRVLVFDHGSLMMDGEPHDVFSDRDQLNQLHLQASQSREIAKMLEDNGMEFPQDVISYEELLQALLKKLGGYSHK